MARLTVPGETDSISIEIPESFVRTVLDTAQEQERIANPNAVEGYRLRVLRADRYRMVRLGHRSPVPSE